jgi:hypothetical protein
MKITLEIDGEKFEVSGDYFVSLLTELALKADLISEDQKLEVVDSI